MKTMLVLREKIKLAKSFIVTLITEKRRSKYCLTTLYMFYIVQVKIVNKSCYFKSCFVWI